MHRCGTSAVAKVLFELGLDMGPCDQFMPANQSNPLGYFENQWISYEVNDVLLEYLGGSWNSPPEFPNEWQKDRKIQALADKVRGYLKENFAASIIGWKDPRVSLLLPFWKWVVPELRFVVCVRNPLDVARSLSAREGYSLRKGAALWHKYVTTLMEETDGCDRHIVFYEDLVSDTEKEIIDIAGFCNLDVPNWVSESSKGIFSELQNHKGTAQTLTEKEAEVLEAVAYYDTLRTTENRVAVNPKSQSKLNTGEFNDCADSEFRIEVPKTDSPVVSIVIPTYNRVGMLQNCLRAVVHFADVPYELIIVDDCSSDSTQEVLGGIKNATVLRNDENLDFLLSTNQGAKLAHGQYILFLNNDVIVRRKFLSTLVNTLESYPDCGAVGPKFINMDGSLQEAGAYVMHDAKVVMYGSSRGAFQPEFSYVREVDYCSAACLLVQTELFRQVGGLDEEYVPAYYEDPDLCFKLKKLGYKVVFQPEVTVFHHMGASRSSEDARKLVSANREKFVRRWHEVLSLRESNEIPLKGRDRREGDRVLVLAEAVPDPDLQSSEIGMLLDFLQQAGCLVTLMPVKKNYTYQPNTRALQQKGIEVVYGPYANPANLIRQRPHFYKAVVTDSGFEDAKFDASIELVSDETEMIKVEQAIERWAAVS